MNAKAGKIELADCDDKIGEATVIAEHLEMLAYMSYSQSFHDWITVQPPSVRVVSQESLLTWYLHDYPQTPLTGTDLDYVRSLLEADMCRVSGYAPEDRDFEIVLQALSHCVDDPDVEYDEQFQVQFWDRLRTAMGSPTYEKRHRIYEVFTDHVVDAELTRYILIEMRNLQ